MSTTMRPPHSPQPPPTHRCPRVAQLCSCTFLAITSCLSSCFLPPPFVCLFLGVHSYFCGWGGWMLVGGLGCPPSLPLPPVVCLPAWLRQAVCKRGLSAPPAAVSVSPPSIHPSCRPSISAAPPHQYHFASSTGLTSVCPPHQPLPFLSPARHLSSLASSSTLSSSMTLLASERSLLIRSKFRSGEHPAA